MLITMPIPANYYYYLLRTSKVPCIFFNELLLNTYLSPKLLQNTKRCTFKIIPIFVVAICNIYSEISQTLSPPTSAPYPPSHRDEMAIDWLQSIFHYKFTSLSSALAWPSLA